MIMTINIFQITYHYCTGSCEPLKVGPSVFTSSAAFVLHVSIFINNHQSSSIIINFRSWPQPDRVLTMFLVAPPLILVPWNSWYNFFLTVYTYKGGGTLKWLKDKGGGLGWWSGNPQKMIMPFMKCPSYCWPNKISLGQTKTFSQVSGPPENDDPLLPLHNLEVQFHNCFSQLKMK